MSMPIDEFVGKRRERSLMELLVERDDIFYDLQNLKKRYVMGDVLVREEPEFTSSDFIDMLGGRLDALDRLIEEKEAADGITADDLQYPDGFLEACRNAYDAVGPIYKAEDMLGCWIFRTTVPLCISGPVGVLKSTGETLHFHTPALYDLVESGRPFAGALVEKIGEPADVILKELGAEHARRPVYRVPAEFQRKEGLGDEFA